MKKAKPMDAVLILLFVLVSLVPLTGLLPRPAQSAQIVRVTTPEGTEEYALDDHTIALDSHGYHLTLAVSADGVQVTSSDCPDHTCMKTGKITRAGNAIVCVPAHVRVDLVGGEGYDGIAG